MNANELLQAGKLHEAVTALTAEVRENPSDSRSRVFLFELLCFEGEIERALKHLDIIADTSPNASLGVLVYRACLAAQVTRERLFENKDYSRLARQSSSSQSFSGTLNGAPFQSITDADPRIGARLEIYEGSEYRLIPLGQIDRLEIEPPKLLRDLLFLPAQLSLGPHAEGEKLRHVFVPALYPHSSDREEEAVRLGRATEWCQDEFGEAVLFGQRILMVDGEELPLLEVRKIELCASGNTVD